MGAIEVVPVLQKLTVYLHWIICAERHEGIQAKDSIQLGIICMSHDRMHPHKYMYIQYICIHAYVEI